MVNTFLPYKSFKKSAKSLDWKRLGNQRREAKRIISILEAVIKLEEKFDTPYIDGQDSFTHISNIIKKYKSQSYIFIEYKNRWIKVNKKNHEKITRLKNKNGHIVKLGYGSHPCVIMWHGYMDALKKYYDEIVKEWIFRGYNNTMEIYDIPENSIVYPKWLSNRKLHMSHRASLCKKNPAHYCPQFGDLIFTDYVWPSKKP